MPRQNCLGLALTVNLDEKAWSRVFGEDEAHPRFRFRGKFSLDVRNVGVVASLSSLLMEDFGGVCSGWFVFVVAFFGMNGWSLPGTGSEALCALRPMSSMTLVP